MRYHFIIVVFAAYFILEDRMIGQFRTRRCVLLIGFVSLFSGLVGCSDWRANRKLHAARKLETKACACLCCGNAANAEELYVDCWLQAKAV